MTRKEGLGLGCAVAVVLFALFFRLGYQSGAVIDDPMRTDAAQYARIGWNILHHGVVSMAPPGVVAPPPDSYRGPGYPLLVSFAMLLGGDDAWYGYMLFMQAVVGALSVALVMAIARWWMSWGYALAAGVLAAAWPHMVTLSGYVLTETLLGFTLLLGIYLLCVALEGRRPYQYVVAALVFGYAALINPAILPFPILVTCALFLTQRRYATLFLVFALSIPLGWTMRGLTIDDSLSASSSGRLMENILIGMEPDFDSFYQGNPAGIEAKKRLSEGLKMYREDPAAELGVVLGRFAERPVFYAKWYLLEKPVRFWQWSIGQGAGDIYVYPVFTSPFEAQPLYRGVASICHGLNNVLMTLSFGLVMVLGYRVVRHRLKEESMPLVVVTLLFVYATVIHTILAPDARYATPFRSMEILLALSLLAIVQKKWTESRASSQASMRT